MNGLHPLSARHNSDAVVFKLLHIPLPARRCVTSFIVKSWNTFPESLQVSEQLDLSQGALSLEQVSTLEVFLLK